MGWRDRTGREHTRGARPLPNVRAIVAACDDWGIGHRGALLVRNPADMRHFKRQTTGHIVIMGRRTLESLPGGRPLPERRNVVLTRGHSLDERPGLEVAHSVEEALGLVGDELAWVVGGDAVYRALLPHCSETLVTRNHCTLPADAFFPDLDADPGWRVSWSADVDDEGRPLATPDGIPFEFVNYVRASILGHRGAL